MPINWDKCIIKADDDTVYTICGKSIIYTLTREEVSGIEWGTISGTLSDQTDLKNALDAKVSSSDLGDMAFVNDADMDGKTYGRKMGTWSEVPVMTDTGWVNITPSEYITLDPSVGKLQCRKIGKMAMIRGTGIYLVDPLTDPWLYLGDAPYGYRPTQSLAVGAEVGCNFVHVNQGGTIILDRNPAIAEIPTSQFIEFTITYMID